MKACRAKATLLLVAAICLTSCANRPVMPPSQMQKVDGYFQVVRTRAQPGDPVRLGLYRNPYSDDRLIIGDVRSIDGDRIADFLVRYYREQPQPKLEVRLSGNQAMVFESIDGDLSITGTTATGARFSIRLSYTDGNNMVAFAVVSLWFHRGIDDDALPLLHMAS